MKTLVWTTLALALSLTAYGQRTETLFDDFDLTGAWGGVTYNYSSYDNDWALLRGGYGGLEFGRNVFVGYGGWRIKDEAEINDGEFEFRYGGFMLGITPISHKAIHPRINMLLGPGRIEYEGDRDRVLVFQPSAGVEFNLFQWWRLGLEGGYRLIANNGLDTISNADVSAPFMQIELRFGFSWD